MEFPFRRLPAPANLCKRARARERAEVELSPLKAFELAGDGRKLRAGGDDCLWVMQGSELRPIAAGTVHLHPPGTGDGFMVKKWNWNPSRFSWYRREVSAVCICQVPNRHKALSSTKRSPSAPTRINQKVTFFSVILAENQVIASLSSVASSHWMV